MHALSRLPGAGALQQWAAAHGLTATWIVAGIGCLVVGLATLLIQGLALPTLLYVPAAMAAASLWLGALAVYVASRAARHKLVRANERQILQLAAQTGQPLTVPAVARSLGISLADAEAALTTLARRGHASADVDLDTGNLQFVIPLHPSLHS